MMKVFIRKIICACLLPAALLVGGCAQSGGNEVIDIATNAGFVEASASSDESSGIDLDASDRDEVNLDGGGFQCDWHEAVELTEEDALPEEELPVAFAEDENFWYDIYEDYVAVVNYIGTDTVVEVPASYEGLPITMLGQIGETSWSNYMPFSDSDVEKVILPEGLLVIGDSAFVGCENLEEIVIPDSVIKIGCSAFGFIDYIPWYENLTDEFVIVGDGCLIKYNGDDTSVTIPDGVKNICGAFECDENLVSVIIPDSVTRITSNAFNFCSALESVTIPESVVEMNYAFTNDCDSLVTVDIPESVTVLTDSFWNCDSLEKVTGAENVTVLSGFAYCRKLESFSFSEGLVEIGDSAFSHSGLTEADFPQSLKVIGDSAFKDCYSLTTVKNGQNVIKVGMSAFMGSAWFKSITDYFVTVGKNVLIGYNGEDSEVVVPITVTYLGGAFCGDTGDSDDPLLSVTLPASVRGCCHNAFSGHPNIQEITILGENFVLGSEACRSLPLESFVVPKGTKILPEDMFVGTNLKEIEISDSVIVIGSCAFECYESEDGSLKTVEIPDSVLMIGDFAFANCKELTDITIPASVTRIGYEVFEGCSENIIIHGEAGSCAESYAQEHGIQFEEISK